MQVPLAFCTKKANNELIVHIYQIEWVTEKTCHIKHRELKTKNFAKQVPLIFMVMWCTFGIQVTLNL